MNPLQHRRKTPGTRILLVGSGIGSVIHAALQRAIKRDMPSASIEQVGSKEELEKMIEEARKNGDGESITVIDGQPMSEVRKLDELFNTDERLKALRDKAFELKQSAIPQDIPDDVFRKERTYTPPRRKPKRNRKPWEY